MLTKINYKPFNPKAMKRSKFFAVIFAVLVSIGFASCEKEEGEFDIDRTQGVIGRWYSAGNDVAPILRGRPFFTDSIYAEMRADFTFRVESYDAARVMTLFTGTFSQRESGIGAIWNITLQQNVPFAGVSEGIFMIHWDENPIRMRYEVLQTTPALGLAPPTAIGGFGSSAGGALGQNNVQVFRRMP